MNPVISYYEAEHVAESKPKMKGNGLKLLIVHEGALKEYVCKFLLTKKSLYILT